MSSTRRLLTDSYTLAHGSLTDQLIKIEHNITRALKAVPVDQRMGCNSSFSRKFVNDVRFVDERKMWV